MTQELMIGFGAVIVIICGIFAFKSFSKKASAKEEATKFLHNLEDKMYATFVGIIDNIDIRAFDTLEEYEAYTLSELYRAAWDFIEEEIRESENKDLISALARKYLTKEFIDSFINKYMEKRYLESDTLENTYGSGKIEDITDDLIAEDKELEEKFSDKTQYNEEVDKEDYDYEEPEAPTPTKEEMDKLIPQDTDIIREEYQDGDSSVEDITEYIEKRTNRGGRTVYYHVDEYGKKKQISKDKALESGLEIKENE